MNAQFYRRSIFDSAYFRANTTTLILALAVAAYIVARFGANLPFLIWVYLVSVSMGLAGAWVRAIVQHGAIQKRLDQNPESVTREELFKLAAYWPTYGLSLLYLVSAILLVALGMIIKHYEILLVHGAASTIK